MRSLLAICLIILFSSPSPAASFKAEFVAASDAVLSNPHDIDLSVDGKYIYVSDLHHDRVAVLDAKSLNLVSAFGKKDGLVAPHDLHIGPDGKLYVADTGNDRIVIFELKGSSGTKTGELSGDFYAPEGVFAHKDGRIYVTGAGSDNIVAYENGKPVAQAEGLEAPHDVISDRKGSLWVADSGNDRMVLMSRDLKVKRVLKGDAYKFRGPRYQDMTDDGLLIVADKYTHSVKIIGPDGGFIAVIGNGKRGKGPNVFTTPEGVVVRGNDIWLSDSGNDRITRYRIMR